MARSNLAEEWPPLRTLTDLALRHWNIRLSCPRCEHVRIVSGGGMWWLFHQHRWSDEVRDAARHLYCAPCRIRWRAKIRPTLDKTRDAPTGDPLPDPDPVAWKRLIARYRS